MIRHNLGDARPGGVAAGGDAAGDIPLADHADEIPVVVIDDETADIMGQHECGGFLNRVVAIDRDDIGWTTGRIVHFSLPLPDNRYNDVLGGSSKEYRFEGNVT